MDDVPLAGWRKGSPRYGEDIVQLQQGHKDPSKSAADKDNIIPQCQFCNQAYRGDFTFDDKDRVRAVADVGPVQRATEEVQRKIFKWQKNYLDYSKLRARLNQ